MDEVNSMNCEDETGRLKKIKIFSRRILLICLHIFMRLVSDMKNN